MPRNLHITAPFQQRRIPAILRTQLRHPKEVIKSNTPRLWNAKRRIKHSWGLNTSQWGAYKYDPKFDWRSKVSPDVVEFIDKNPNLLPEEKAAAIFNPSRYFSRPHHVPEEQRKQIYLPTFSVTFIRTPQHGPFYAHFEVPIWFNKLDMKSYLKNVYSVEVVHIRSYVTHGKKDHHSAHRPGSEGPAFRQPRKKRMTVQLVEPFQWPEEPKDFSEWEQPEYWRSLKAQVDLNRRENKQWATANPNLEHRNTIAQQAQELLQGKTGWKPTWTQIPDDVRIMSGIVGNEKAAGISKPGGKGGLPPPPDERGAFTAEGGAAR